MRKPPRPTTLIFGLVLVALVIWRLFEWGKAPPPALDALLSAAPAASSAAPSPGAGPRRRAKAEPAAPLPLLSASATVDAAEAGTIAGRVVSSESGKGIGGARLVFERGAAREVVCGADGAFKLSPPEPGAYKLVHASADGYVPFAPESSRSPVTLTAQKNSRIEGFVLTLDPIAQIVVKVVSPDGKPVAGAEVSVLGASDAQAVAKLTTNEGGEARGAIPRDAILEARHKDFAPGRTRMWMGAQASHAITIRLKPKGERALGGADKAIAGRVLSAGGDPVAGARVVASIEVENRAAAGADLHPTGADVTGADGAFRIEGLDEGTYSLLASDDEHAPARKERVAAGAEGVVLNLGASGSIEGTVVDSSGAPMVAFSVVVSLSRGPLEKEHAATRSFLDPQGRFSIEGLGPGDYEVVAVAAASAPSAPAKATISDPPGAPVTVKLTLSHGATLRGTVVDGETKKPVAGAHVALEGALGGGENVPLLATAATDDHGAFELRGLGAGMRSLTVSAEGHHGRIVSGIVVTDADPAPITVELTPTKKGEEPSIEMVGIGAVLTPKDDALLIGQTIPGGGAAEAGLGTGDAVLAIDAVNVTDLGFEGSIQRIRGPEGSTVVLSVRKAGAGEAIDIVVPRRRIKG